MALTMSRIVAGVGLALVAVLLGGALGSAYAVLFMGADADDLSATGRSVFEEPDFTAPPAPSLIAPADGMFPGSRTPTFEWAPVEDDSGAMYVVEYGPDLDFDRNVTHRVANRFDPRYHVPEEKALAPGVRVYWRVMAFDGYWNEGPWSAVRSFVPMIDLLRVDVSTPVADVDLDVAVAPPVLP